MLKKILVVIYWFFASMFTYISYAKNIAIVNNDSSNGYTISLQFQDEMGKEINGSRKSAFVEPAKLFTEDQEKYLSGFYSSYWQKKPNEKKYAFKKSSSTIINNSLDATCRKVILFMQSANGKYRMRNFNLSYSEMEQIFMGADIGDTIGITISIDADGTPEI